ncbi:hypothetical protein [Dawidia soli]|uniref:Uncharacterized protein n=1 Tax=Dawidia soli TaxID=2782352 RepID=A0AAP2D9T5_9BACT|nr:hypothetical protein [Dawidia soli]MBT1687602.1 hypothetical protein [Dawidia soli]
MPKTKTLNTNNTNDITDARPAMKKPTKKVNTTVSSVKSNTNRHGSTKRK